MFTSVQRKLKTFSPKQFLVLGLTCSLTVVGAYGLLIGDVRVAGGAVLVLLTIVALLLLLTLRSLSYRLAEGFSSLSDRAVPTSSVMKVDKGVVPRGRAHKFSVLDFWARRYSKSMKTLDWATRALVKHRSVDGRDILAHAATRGGHNSGSLSEVLAVWRSSGLKSKLKLSEFPFDTKSAVAYARVLYRQRLSLVDLLDAVSIYEILLDRGGKGLEPMDHAYLVDATTTLGRFDDAKMYLERFADSIHSIRALNYLRANAINPYVSGVESDEEEWLSQVNKVLVDSGLEPVELRPGTEPAFYRLHCNVGEVVQDGPLVSVLMPVYEANDATDLAIRSILAQSWSNLELIIVDDGSPAEYHDRLRKWEGADPRLKIIFNDENKGAYWARNTAYELAKGDFVTVADKDDWHHPRKLELQARDLVENPHSLGNMTSWVRVDRNLRFLVRWGPMRIVHPSFASIFFRRELVKERLGFWDNVRKGGDGEYKFRMQRVFGVNLQPMNTLPLAFSLMDEGNLTSNDLGLGFEHPNRTIYRKTYEQWHLRIKDGESPYLPRNPESRPFPAPREFLPDRPEHPEFDVIFVSEFGFMGGSSRSLENEIEVCLQRNFRVGVVCLENLMIWTASDRGPSARIHELILDGKITRLPLTDQARAKLLVIRWPAVLQYRAQLLSRIRADRAVIVANHAPYESHGRRNSYDPQVVSRNVKTLFEVEPVWVPQSGRIREMLIGLLASEQLSPVDWVGILPNVESRWLDRREPLGERPIIGRHSRDDLLKWPAREVLEQVYPLDGEFDVRILGGVSSLVANETVSASEIASWTVYEFDGVPPDKFLQTIDFFVYYHHPALIEAYGMTIVEAMASAAVVILPPHFEQVFGAAALYAEPDQVRGLVRTYWSDWNLYREQSERGRAYVLENSTPEAYCQRVALFGIQPASMQPAQLESGADSDDGGLPSVRPASTGTVVMVSE